MRKLLLSAAVFGLISSQGSVAQAQAQAQQLQQRPGHGANAAHYGVGVVDISFIFNNYPQFKAQIEKLKGEMAAADAALKSDVDQLKALEAQRDSMKAGSDEWKQRDEALARQKADFGIKQGTVRRDFLERESQVYYHTYRTVSEAITRYAQQNNIGMVLRFNGDQVDAAQREDVMRMIMQPIVYQNNVDITPGVLMVLGVDVSKLPATQAVPSTAVRPTASGARPQ